MPKIIRHPVVFTDYKLKKDGRCGIKDHEYGEPQNQNDQDGYDGPGTAPRTGSFALNEAAGLNGVGTFQPPSTDAASGGADERPKTHMRLRSRLTKLRNGSVHSESKLHCMMDDGSVEMYRCNDIDQMDMKGNFKRSAWFKSSEPNSTYSKIKMTENHDGSVSVEKTPSTPVSNAKKIASLIANLALVDTRW